MRQWIALFLLLLLPGMASAAGGGGGDTVSLGVLLGPALRSDDGFALGFEFKAGYRLMPLLVVSALYWRTDAGTDIKSGSNDISADMVLSGFGGEALYMFSSFWYGGIKTGIMSESKTGVVNSATNANISDSSSSLFLAPTIVYEAPVGSLSFGVEGSYFYPLSSSVSKALSLMGMVRFKF